MAKGRSTSERVRAEGLAVGRSFLSKAIRAVELFIQSAFLHSALKEGVPGGIPLAQEPRWGFGATIGGWYKSGRIRVRRSAIEVEDLDLAYAAESGFLKVVRRGAG